MKASRLLDDQGIFQHVRSADSKIMDRYGNHSLPGCFRFDYAAECVNLTIIANNGK